MDRYTSGLLDVSETCDYLRISRTTLYRLRDSKEIPAVKLGHRVFFNLRDLDTYIRNQTAFAA